MINFKYSVVQFSYHNSVNRKRPNHILYGKGALYALACSFLSFTSKNLHATHTWKFFLKRMPLWKKNCWTPSQKNYLDFAALIKEIFLQTLVDIILDTIFRFLGPLGQTIWVNFFFTHGVLTFRFLAVCLFGLVVSLSAVCVFAFVLALFSFCLSNAVLWTVYPQLLSHGKEFYILPEHFLNPQFSDVFGTTKK